MHQQAQRARSQAPGADSAAKQSRLPRVVTSWDWHYITAMANAGSERLQLVDVEMPGLCLVNQSAATEDHSHVQNFC